MTYIPTTLRKWTMPDHYFGEIWPDYYSSGFGQSRDSDALERSNFRCVLKALGGESETVIVVREGHWAVGWVEWIAIHESDDQALQTSDEIKAACKDYPVVDESDWSEEEQNEADETWRNCYDWQERIRYIRDNRSQFEPHDWRDLMHCVRGEYFLGCASELIT